MDKYLDDIERIEAYLDDSMNDVDRVAFARRLDEESALATQFSHRRMLQKSWIKAHEHDHLKKRIRTIITNEKKTTSSYRKILLVAASLILFAAIGTLVVLTVKKNISNPGIADKKIPVEQSEKAIQPEQNRMDEFAGIDSIASTANYFPLNNSSFLESDTIHFQVPLNEGKVQLRIYSIPEKYLTKEVTIPTGTKEYDLQPFSLKKGKYYWTISGNDAQYFFTVK